MKRKLSLLLLLCALIAAAAPVKVSSFGFDAADATDCLQRAINSGARELLVDYTGKEWLIRPVKLRSNQTVFFADKVVVRALPGDYSGIHDYMLSGKNLENIKLIGQGQVVLRMNKPDYQDAGRYQRSEWRHLISIQSCDNVEIRNLELRASGGDGIYIGRDFAAKTGRGCRNVEIENVRSIDHHRQGMSIISVENIRVKNSVFNATRGISPQTGVDFEPNFAKEILGDCVMENCEFNDNYNNGLDLYLIQLNEKSASVNFLFQNCRFRNNRAFGAKITFINAFTPQARAVRGAIKFTGCTFDGNRLGAISVSGAQPDGALVEFNDCKLIQAGSHAPIELANDSTREFGNLRFRNVTVDDFSTAPSSVRFVSFAGYGVADVSGIINIRSAAGGRSLDTATLAACHPTVKAATKSGSAVLNTQKLIPVSGTVPVIRRSLDFRHDTTFVQYAKAGQDVVLNFSVRQYNPDNPPIRIPIQPITPSGRNLDRVIISGTEHRYTLKAAETGIYRFKVSSPRQVFRVSSDSPGFGFDASTPVNLFRSNGSLFFTVPAGVKSGMAIVTGAYAEPVDAELLDASGKVIDAAHRIEGFKALTFNRPDSAGETYMHLRFTNAVEDYHVRLAAPLIPVLSESPDVRLHQLLP